MRIPKRSRNDRLMYSGVRPLIAANSETRGTSSRRRHSRTYRATTSFDTPRMNGIIRTHLPLRGPMSRNVSNASKTRRAAEAARSCTSGRVWLCLEMLVDQGGHLEHRDLVLAAEDHA